MRVASQLRVFLSARQVARNLKCVRSWKDESISAWRVTEMGGDQRVATGNEPPWAWYQYMKLIETVAAIQVGPGVGHAVNGRFTGCGATAARHLAPKGTELLI